MLTEAEEEGVVVKNRGVLFFLPYAVALYRLLSPGYTHRLKKDTNGTWTGNAGKSQFLKAIVYSGHVHQPDGSSYSLTRREDEAAELGQA